VAGRVGPLLMLALCSWLAAGCSSGSSTPAVRQGGTLRVSLDSYPISLNPLVADDAVSAQAYAPLFPLLYTLNADLSVGPDLAASLPTVSDSGTVLTVPIRSDAKWSDGTPITADDVVFTVTTETNPSLAAHAGMRWPGLKSVSRVDQFTVKFTLSSANASFIAAALVTPVVPQHALAHVTPAEIAQDPFSSGPTVTGGPFKFDHRVAGQAIYLNANPNYFLGGPHIAHIVETVINDSAQTVNQLENGTLSWAPNLSAGSAASAASAPGITVSAYASTALDAVTFNVRAGHRFADRAVRQAFAYSIDHDALVAQATSNAPGYPVWGDVNPSSWAFDQAAALRYAPDTSHARQLLTHDGWSVPGSGVASRGAQTLAAQLIYPSSDASRASAATLISQMARVNGFALTATGLDEETFRSAVSSANFDAAIVSVPTEVDPDNSALLSSGGSLNYGGYASASMDAAISAELAATAGAGQNLQQVRKPLFSRIEQLVSADLPMYFLWVPRAFTGFNATVGGVAGVGDQLIDDRADSYYRDWYLTS
jgi:peptide/nickel transport system substrate-binding protein